MRILHLIPSLAGGGAERQLAYLAGGLVTRGCEIHLGIIREGVYLSRVAASGAVIHRISASSNYDPRLPARVIRLIRTVRPDLLQTWLTQMDILGGTAALLTGVPWIMSERSSAGAYLDTKHNVMRRWVARFASAIIANSNGGADVWSRVRTGKHVVPNMVDFDEIDSVPRAPLDSGVAPLVLFAGRLDAAKNLSNLVDALAIVASRREMMALFCGLGPEEADVRERIAARGLNDRIRLRGFADDVWSLMKRADLLVSASWFEGHPNVVIEAAACRCPLVLSDIPAHREFLDESSALFAPPDDPDAIAAAIERVLDDPAAAQERAGRARQIVGAWSIDHAADIYLDIYRSILERRQAAHG